MKSSSSSMILVIQNEVLDIYTLSLSTETATDKRQGVVFQLGGWEWG
jgi:hypothetical protein